MLSRRDEEYIDSSLWVYDHAWMAYSSFLGEAYLIDDYLTYFDGSTLFVCAYNISRPSVPMSATNLAEIADARPEFHTARAVQAWGTLGPQQNELRMGGQVLKLVGAKSSPDGMDYLVDINLLRESPTRSQLKRSARVGRLGYQTVAWNGSIRHHHIRLIESWAQSHDLPDMAVAMAVGCVSAWMSSTKQNAVVFETVREDATLPEALTLVYETTNSRLVALLSFYPARGGQATGDAVHWGLLHFAMQAGLDTVHLGYASTSGLRDFKASWGGRPNGRPFQERFYTRGPTNQTLPETATYWNTRLYSVVRIH